MRLSKSKLFAVQVANFAAEHGMSGRDVVELVTLAERAFAAGVRNANLRTPESEHDECRTRDLFELRASDCGFKTYWGGLWPTLQLPLSGTTVHLPCESN